MSSPSGVVVALLASFGFPAGALAAAPGLPAPPASCSAPLVTGDPLDFSDVTLGAGDDHFRPGTRDARDETFVSGRGGADCLLGSPARDLLDGGPGGDLLAGERGVDALDGGPGDDTLSTGDPETTTGGETASGGQGDDVVVPGPGATDVVLGAGDDRVLAADGSSGRIACGPGEDTVVADAGDVLTGCEHPRRLPPVAVTVTSGPAGVTVALASPWGAATPRDELAGWAVTVTRPHRPGCGGLRAGTAPPGAAQVVVRLRRGRVRPCTGRWTAQVTAWFLDDAGSECDGGDCGVGAADVGPRTSFTVT